MLGLFVLMFVFAVVMLVIVVRDPENSERTRRQQMESTEKKRP